jgi:hypothetical protein
MERNKEFEHRDVAATTWGSPLQTKTLNTETKTLQLGNGALSPTRATIRRTSVALRPHKRLDRRQPPTGSRGNLNAWGPHERRGKLRWFARSTYQSIHKDMRGVGRGAGGRQAANGRWHDLLGAIADYGASAPPLLRSRSRSSPFQSFL